MDLGVTFQQILSHKFRNKILQAMSNNLMLVAYSVIWRKPLTVLIRKHYGLNSNSMEW